MDRSNTMVKNDTCNAAVGEPMNTGYGQSSISARILLASAGIERMIISRFRGP